MLSEENAVYFLADTWLPYPLIQGFGKGEGLLPPLILVRIVFLPASVSDWRRKYEPVYGAGGRGNGVAFTHPEVPRALTARILK